MPLQIETMCARAQAKRIQMGRGYGSERTLAEAGDSMKAYEDLTAEQKAQLAEHDYRAADRTLREDARAVLLESNIERDAEQAENETLTGDALKRGKQARRRAEAVLHVTHSVLEEREDGEAGAQAIEVALRMPSSSDASADLLRQQLLALRAPLLREDVAAVAAERGGPAALAAIDASGAELREVDQRQPDQARHPVPTERPPRRRHHRRERPRFSPRRARARPARDRRALRAHRPLRHPHEEAGKHRRQLMSRLHAVRRP